MFLRRSTIRTCFLLLFMICYLIFGALIFSLLEAPRERDLKKDVLSLRQKFLENHTCLSDVELEDFISYIIKANNRGVSATANATGEPNWSFGQSLFFSATVLTTIGYGHVTPLSEGGKLFCIIYAMFGIPLVLILFTALVERLLVVSNCILSRSCSLVSRPPPSRFIRLMHITALVIFLVTCMFLVPAAIFTALEPDWHYLDAFYYCFISLSTIGLGDYIPGDHPQQQHRVLYKICTTVYLFIGLTLMMLTLASIYEVPELNIGSHFYLKNDEDEAERKRLKCCPNSENSIPNYTEQSGNFDGGYQGPAAIDDKDELTST